MTSPASSGAPFAVCAGIAALDVIMDTSTLPGPDERVLASSVVLSGGGPAATAAVAIARLGGLARLAAVTGDDDAGMLIRAGLRREGLPLDLVSTLVNHSSAVSVGLIPATAPTTRSLVAYQAGAVLAQSDALADACTRAAWVHVDHAGWAIVPWLRGRGVTTPVSVDGGNPISGLDVATVALYAPSAAELMRSTGTNNVDDGLDAALDRGARVCIATLGSTGAVARSTVDPGERDFTGLVSEASVPSSGPRTSRWTVRAGAASAAIRSTLGAGDVYHGALLAALLRGDALAPAMQFAAVASAWSCRAVDGRSAIPAAADVDATVASVPVEVEVWHPQGRHVPGGPMAAASR